MTKNEYKLKSICNRSIPHFVLWSAPVLHTRHDTNLGSESPVMGVAP